MKNLLTAIFICIVFSSCHHIKGSGNIVTEKRNVGHFDGVKTSGSIDIEIRNGDGQSVEVEADDNVQEYVITEVSGGLLTVHYKSNTAFINAHAKVIVTAPSLRKLITSGSGDVVTIDTITDEEEIEVTASGSGNVKAIVDAPSIKARTTGSGNVTLQGRTKNFDCTGTGSGDLKCRDLMSENTNVRTTGSGNAHVYASVNLKVQSSGSGDVYYSGNPSSPQLHKSGSGDLKQEN